MLRTQTDAGLWFDALKNYTVYSFSEPRIGITQSVQTNQMCQMHYGYWLRMESA